ncbi:MULTISPECIES: ATP-binding protein [Fusobacterium]|uniref:tRNA 2-thiocytidine biosynthesis TtcA family protein n=1 Tax=Fusobacterium TaxID=848 RepID=UPI001F10E346|nr:MULTISPECIES: ATP-binding protein [Fusobacterium]
MIKISNIKELNSMKIDTYYFEVLENIIKISNKKEKYEININYRNDNIISTLETIKKLTEIKISLDRFQEREILSYIESKGFNKTLWNSIGKAMHKFNMIEHGDRIAVGISGGKDSLVLFNSLVRIKKVANIDFEIVPIHIHMKEDTSDLTELKKYIEKFGYSLQVIETNLKNLVVGETREKNPCFLCGRIRRGILYTTMKNQKLNKLALGHHKDDIIETFLLNIIYQGNRNIMKPSYFSEEHQVQIIRPLAFVEEKNIISYSKKLSLPILEEKCPYESSADSKRLKIKNIIKNISLENPDVRSIILNSIEDLF